MKASEYIQNQISAMEIKRNWAVCDIDLALNNIERIASAADEDPFKVNENTANLIMGYAETIKKAVAEKEALEAKIKEFRYIMNLETE